MIGDRAKVSGYVTQEKYLTGRTLSDLERYLGFKSGRLAMGATFLKLDRVPGQAGFELAGYSMTAAHRHTTPEGLDISKLKELVLAKWTLVGPDRVVKVWPQIRNDPAMDPDEQYPPGSGVPQWRLLAEIDATVVAELRTGLDRYQPAL
jgi:hypothetical protein